MTTQEFSNMFDTLLNSFNHKAEFGDQISYADVSLDEYEKSVFLTQAQDNIIKRYFERNNSSSGAGFDDNVRRQADFSALISVNVPTPITTGTSVWVPGVTFFNTTRNTITGSGNAYIGFVLRLHFGQPVPEGSEAGVPTVEKNVENGIIYCDCGIPVDMTPAEFFTAKSADITTLFGITLQTNNPTGANYIGILGSATAITTATEVVVQSYKTFVDAAYDDRGLLYAMPMNILLMLNEKYKVGSKNYVVVPISYTEYDRQMSKAYAQPLKKQCWRLFQGQASNGQSVSEIIPIEGVTGGIYKIRYIRRPRPIILTNLGFDNSQEALNIDGYSEVTECELTPILHMDILNEAVRLALNSAGIETRDMRAEREAARGN